MADFDLTQTDAQVQSILNDGQNMQGAGAQTTLTTESVLLKDVNGNYHKILKSSFTEAIRDTLAGLLVNNDKGTTINQIAAIASGDFGSITPANLASVLGGNIYRGILNNKDLNNITTVGCYSVQEGVQNRPVDYWGQLNVVALDNNAVAQYFTTNTIGSEGSSIYFRKKISSSWSSWLQLDNFGCPTPADLASLLGVRGLTQNLKYIENLNVPSGKYLKILVRNQFIDNVWQRKGIGTSNFIATISGYGYRWDCVKLEYPFTGYHTKSKFRADLLNKENLSEISIGKRPSGDNDSFFGTIFVKFNSSVTIYGYFEAISVTVVDEPDATIWRTLSSPELGENLF